MDNTIDPKLLAEFKKCMMHVAKVIEREYYEDEED